MTAIKAELNFTVTRIGQRRLDRPVGDLCLGVDLGVKIKIKIKRIKSKHIIKKSYIQDPGVWVLKLNFRDSPPSPPTTLWASGDSGES